MLAFVVFLVALALLFDFLNGMNDAANSIATVISTRVLSPRLAVLWAAFFNFVAAFVFGVHVANTIGKGIVDPRVISPAMLLATLVGAIVWTWLCTSVGLPISVSHALVGGLVGAGVAKGGFGALLLPGLLKIAAVHRSRTADRFRPRRPAHGGGPLDLPAMRRRARWIACSAGCSCSPPPYSASATAPTTLRRPWASSRCCCFSTGYLGDTSTCRCGSIFACYAAIALGTLTGGWRVIETMGMRMTKLRPVDGFCAETAAAVSILLSTLGGVPVSTTHTITGAIIGVGAPTRLGAVRWGMAYRIVWAWILTIPASALTAALTWLAVAWLGLAGGP